MSSSIAADARPRARVFAFAGIALLAGWMVYAVPPARARAVAMLRPWLGATLPAEPGLRIGDLRARRGEIDGQTVLYVEGSLANATARTAKTPTLRVALLGDDGRPVYSWKAKVAKPQVEAGKETTFQTRLLAPPEKFKSIAVTAE
jgi:hypothetical protein